jgi:Fe2+ transport system protein FeoA
MRLSELVPGQWFRVLNIVSGGEIGKRFVDLGFVSGAEGKVIRSTFLGGPMQIKLGNYNLVMRRHEAQLVEVDLLASTMIAENSKEKASIDISEPGSRRKHHHGARAFGTHERS